MCYARLGQLLDWIGQPAHAEANYRRALAFCPSHLAASSGLGRLLLRSRRFEEAADIWHGVVEQSPASPAFAFQFARALHRSGRVEEATAQYLHVLALDPLHEKALGALKQLAAAYVTGSRATAPSRIERTTEIGRRILDLTSASPEGLVVVEAIARALSAAAMPHLEQAPHIALAHYTAALVLVPEQSEAQRGAALCFERTGQFAEAVALLDRQIEANPEAVEPRLQRDRILTSMIEAVERPVPDDGRAGREDGLRAAQEREAMLAHARRLIADERGGTVAAKPEPASLQQRLHAARDAAREGRVAEAEQIFREVLDRDGTEVDALAGLAQLCRSQGRWSDAAELLARVIVLRPQSVQPRHWLAHALLQDGQLEAAAGAYTDLSVREPTSADVWQSLAQLQKRLGRWSAAREAWARLIELSPDRTGPRFELAWACHQEGDVAAAQARLLDVLGVDPDHRPALALLGRISSGNDPEASLAWWSRLAALDAEAIEPPLQIARIHLRQERLPEAEAAFRTVLEAQAGHAEASASLARILFERAPGEAIEVLQRWARHDPLSAAPWLVLGRLHADARQADLAEAAYRKALDVDPANLEALTRLARLLGGSDRQDEALDVWLRLGDLAPDRVEPKLQAARILYTRHDPRAEAALRGVLAIEPANRQALRQLAQLLGRTRATVDAALEVWQTLADLDPESVVPIAQRGRLLERIGRTADAEAEYRRAIARDPRHSMALGDLARFYRVQRRWEEAASVYRTLLDLDPDRLDAVLGLGQCLDRTNRLPEARDLYDRALALDPANITALGYRGRLLRARGQVNDAIADFRRICDLEPRNAEAWHELIFQLAGAEREPEALDALARAETALGETPQAWAILGRAAAASLFDDQAFAYFRRAIEAEPQNAAHHAQLGLHYFRQGILDGALHHLLDSRDLDPRDVEVARSLFDTTSALQELGFDHVALRRQPRTVGDILVPERLFAHVKRLSETVVRPYDPVPRKIVAISATLAPGGAERQLANMLRGLSDPRFDLDLALFCISLAPRLRRDFFLPVLEDTGVEVVVPDAAAAGDYLHDPDVKPFAAVIRLFPSDMVGPIAFWLREFRRRRPQVVHAWQDSTNLTAVVAGLLAGVPRIVLCCRSVRPDNPRRRLRRYMQAAYQAVLAHPAVVLSNNSRAGADDYAAWLGIDPARAEVVHNGIDFDRLDRSADSRETANIREQLGIPPTAPVLGSVFRMSEEKRPLLWLDVAAAVARSNRDVQFVVCGDGPMRDEMRDHASALGIADRLHMPGAQANIGSWYGTMDVVMLTSRHEGLPNVLLEAQSLGIPVVAPDVGGMSEVVEQGVTGWTVRDADAESLAERVLFCLSDEAWRAAATERAPRFVRELFSVEAMLRRNLEVYGIPPQAATHA